jgi:hypothetical protein
MSARSFDLNKKRQGNITVYHDGLDFYQIVLHNTAVFTRYNDGMIELNSGGWQTNTTKTAINRAFDLFGVNGRVWQTKFVWKLTYEGITTNFEDGMQVNGAVWRMLKRLSIG